MTLRCFDYSETFFLTSGEYLNPERSATRVSSVADVPLGLYIPVSHSLMVCCLVPSSSASPDCVSFIWRRNALIPVPSHFTFCFFWTITSLFYTL
jgi:hypothetical protein